ncbi:rod-binding protein [Phenylobacterium sp.]|uniref:rod-binding protein n=1 Tax=Phenylobacterium sp. TaxID=1871053 RepID=UPI00122602F1|nr:MAG: chemotaxis protein chel [Phenylobacterium sp.]
MTDLTAAAFPANLLTPAAPAAAAPSAAELAKRGQIKDTAQKFESSFLSVMIGQMFEHEDDGTDKAFTGGSGADMFKSFLADGIAKKMVANGGVGLAASVQREMLKMQGLH